MKKLIQLALAGVILISTPVFAEIKIAVLDWNTALVESDAFKKYEAEDEKKFSGRLDKIKALETEAIKMQQRLQKDASKLKQSDLERLDLEYKQKVREVQELSQQFNEDRAAAEQEFLEKNTPKLNKAVAEVFKEGGYDLLIERSAVIDLKPQLDITLRVVERLNQLR